ncbi:hypothetical protein W97_06454 [Coniosporium apollinis CBS 100218]|uniref:NIMA interactive protein n=1 Tax=Coniosporium apollinis (strain CBS 100218) TaxID=1168221 RepID=R7YZX5_CONA1|nr:uncharacterized protein W97_06454 [Coniosporium apollinis CBS 100218]EON67201.1 hypothetical protein W97_06454 [Coniosporium apollinis CBS 100218]
MDSTNLKTASSYLNNLLLARGLLRDGNTIPFHRPSKASGGAEATLAQIINLVHDLILRRDRDLELTTTHTSTIHTLRVEAARSATTLTRLQTRTDDLARQLSIAQSQERAARAAARTAEASARALRDEMARLKASVAQIRTACANDVRKRDVQIQRLKGHLTMQQRGNRAGLVGASITITPGVTGMGAGSGREEEAGKASVGTEDPAYSLRQETTEFLTQLGQSLSDENDALIGLVRGAVVTLKELQGIPEAGTREQTVESTAGADGINGGGEMLCALPTSYDALAADLGGVLENLKMLLTNPNFVPLDEVAVREEEIARLRHGWEKMEARWKEAVGMMQSWQERMRSGGDTVTLHDLNLGLGLDEEPKSASAVQGEVEEVSRDELPDSADAEEADMDGEEMEEADDDALSGHEDAAETNVELQADETLPPDDQRADKNHDDDDMFNLHLPPEPQPLQEGSGNTRSPRKVAFAPSHPNTPLQHADENASSHDLPSTGLKPPPSAEPQSTRSADRSSRSQSSRKVRLTGMDIILSPSDISIYIDPLQALKRLSSPHAHAEERSPKLTVQEKLNVAQAEAEAAAAAALASVPEREIVSGENGSARGMRSPRKTRITGRPRRRKSTLTPEELENLLVGSP